MIAILKPLQVRAFQRQGALARALAPRLAKAGAALALATLAGAVPPPQEPAEAPLESWLRDHRRGRVTLDAPGLDHLADVVRAVEERAAASPGPVADDGGPKRTLETALLDLAALDLVPSRRGRSDEEAQPNPFLPRARALGRDALARRMDREGGDELVSWLIASVLEDGRAPLGHRLVAAELFEGRHLPPTLAPLLDLAQHAKKARLRSAALAALVGWPEPAVTRAVLAGLNLAGERKPEALPVPLPVARRHLAELDATPHSEERVDEVLAILAPALRSEDWRTASRALELVGELHSNAAYPVLIDALEAWIGRRGTDGASRRIEFDLIDELSRRSSRHLGDRVERWRNWWSLVERGEVPPPPAPGEEDGASKASFFNLRPNTQRVAFIIDRSGSMSAAFGGTVGHSRFQEAIDQTIGFLELSGEDTEFNVTLFSSDYQRWKPRLRPATPRNLDALRTWLEQNGPEGSTHLREAVEDALELDRDGRPNLARLEADTIIVLCDGATASGSDWVVPTMARVWETARVVFHCVYIGNDGDGSLELLAGETGGDFIHIRR